MGCGASTYDKPAIIKTKWFNEFHEVLPDMSAKVVAVTGCTTGTGLVAAKALAEKGASIIMLNRKSVRSEAAEKAVKAAAKNADVETIECDLQSFASVKAAAATISSKYATDGIDVLCCNAGVMALRDQATGDGYDVQVQTNHLSHFLLTKELFPLLEMAVAKRGTARVVSHSSLARYGKPKMLEAKYFGKNGGNLGGDGASMFGNGARWQRYSQTKLANSVYTQTLAAKLKAKGSGVIAVCAAPGLATTNLQVTTWQDKGMGSGTWFMKYGQSAEDGTMPLLHCCVMPVESGQFIEPSKMGHAKGPPLVAKLQLAETDAASGAMLWAKSEEACGAWAL